MSDINIGLLAENQDLSEFEITENFSCIRFLDQNKEKEGRRSPTRRCKSHI